jgi:D-glycero-D-manno-heptose 1,7-bisphosphate phosphatase
MLRVINCNEVKSNNPKTLFIDRDGVINKKVENGYVTNLDQFEFIEGALEGLKILSNNFDYVIVVTNQRGIGKEQLTNTNLETIHDFFLSECLNWDIKISLIIHSPFLEDSNFFRKPNVGMAFLAKIIIPNISFDNSVMIGDSESDILFGKTLNMNVFRITKEHDFLNLPNNYPDLITLAQNYNFNERK